MLNTCETVAKRHDEANWTPPTNAWHLPGFVEDGVTYESHEFWVEFHGKHWESKTRPDATLWMRNGSEVSSIEVRHMFGRPLRDMFLTGGMISPAFKLCWGVFELARDATANGERQARFYHLRAFVNGWLKKRKLPGRNGCKVWIEDPKHMCGARFFGSKHTIAFEPERETA